MLITVKYISEATLRSDENSNWSRKAGRHEAQYRYSLAYPNHVYVVLGPYLYGGRHQTATEIEDAGGECSDNGYVLIVKKELVLGVGGLEDTEGEGEACAGD